MRELLAFYLLALSIAHVGSLGSIRYLFIVLTIIAFLVIHRRIYLANSILYNIGGLILFTGVIISFVLHPGAEEAMYVFFIFVNYLIYPAFAKYRMPASYLIGLSLVLMLSFAPIGGYDNGLVTIYGNPNNLATVILSVAYISMVACDGKLLRQLAFYIPLVILMFLSASRTQLGCILLFGGIYFTQRYVFRHNFKLLAILGVFVMTFAYITLVSGDALGIIDLIQENSFSHKQNRGLSRRDELLFISLDILEAHPFGVGMGNSSDYIGERIGIDFSPHNMYMKMAVEGGFLMLTGYVIILLTIMYYSRSIACNSFMLAIVMRGFFESSTPFTISLISSMMVLPYFMNENTIDYSRAVVITIFRKKRVRRPLTALESGAA